MGTRAGLDYPEGKPDSLAAAAARLSALAAAVAADAASVARAGRVHGWRGRSSRLFAVAADQLARPLDTGANALHQASRTVDDLADLIRQAQARIRAWAEEIEEAERQAEVARSALRAATLPASVLAGQAWDLGRQRDAQVSYDRAVERVADLRARYQPKARQLCEEIERADRSTGLVVFAAADAAPAGGATVPGAPRVPADVRAFAPVWLFAPGESYLPADPRRFRNIDDFDSLKERQRYLHGQGAGAPIFYRVRHFGDEKVIEYWFYRRWNDFRDLGIRGVTSHPDDSEGVAVRIFHGRPVQIGYTQHEHGCSLPFADAPKRRGHPVSFPGDGSGSNSPYPGAADNKVNVLGFDINPYEDLHGPAPGERTPRDHVVHGEDNLPPYRERSDWRLHDPAGNRVPDSETERKKVHAGFSHLVRRLRAAPSSGIGGEEATMLISNDPGQTRSAGSALSSAGASLVSSATLTNVGDGAGGDAAPRTDGALGSLSRAWHTGLTAYGNQAEALGGFADLMAAAFEVVDGPRR